MILKNGWKRDTAPLKQIYEQISKTCTLQSSSLLLTKTIAGVLCIEDQIKNHCKAVVRLQYEYALRDYHYFPMYADCAYIAMC